MAKNIKETGRRVVIGTTGLALAGLAAFGGVKAVESITDSGSNDNQPAPAAYATPTPSEAAATPTPKPSEAAGTPTPRAEMPSFTKPASKDSSGNWVVNNPDGQAENILSINGFTPDASLVLAPEWGKAMTLNPAKFADFQPSLNNPNHPLVGYTYGENDQSDNIGYRRTLQVPIYSWTVATGEEVDAPGIGHLKGGPGRAVELMIMNIDGTVGDFGSDNPIMIKHGFTGTGRIWDGNNVVEDEQGISSHYVSRLQNGVTLPGESGFVGQCNTPSNCKEVLVVSVIRRQWGQNKDGSNRYQYQLLREAIVSK